MDSRPFKIAAIRARIDFCEAERRHLLEMVTSYQVDLAWISERMNSLEKELRFLHRDLEALDPLTSNG
jgi:hypothetical protein